MRFEPPIIKTALRLSFCKSHPEIRLETLILRQKCDDKRTPCIIMIDIVRGCVQWRIQVW